MKTQLIQKLALATVAAITISSAHAATNLLTNGNFEAGSLAGWTVTDLAGGSGTFYLDTPGTTTPNGFPTVSTAANGSFYAVTDQPGPGTHSLIQSFTVPANASSVILAFDMFINDQSGAGPIVDPAGLDHNAFPNQHARVDLLTSGATAFDTGAGVISNYYLGVDAGPNPNPFTSYSFDITGSVAPGGTYQIRFAQVDNSGNFNQGVDNVSIMATTSSVPDAGSTVLMLGLSLGSIFGFAGLRKKSVR